jgi:excisionase family DNA binding protein
MNEHLSTREVGWILGRSPGTVRDMIVAGEIEATRTVEGYRIPKEEALRLGRERIEAETGRKLPKAELERLIDEVIRTNEEATT